jgi:hypothetical protein
VTVAVPTETPVNVTVHLPEDRVQLAVTVPIEVLEERKPTVPPGIFDAVVVSTTVTVQVEVPVGTIVLGLQAIAMDVLSLPVAVTVTVAPELVLVLWVASPP